MERPRSAGRAGPNPTKEGRMSQPRRVSSRLPMVIAAALLLLAGQPAMAGHTHSVSGDPTTPWAVHLQVMDDALKTKSISAAARAWREAYGSALGSRDWQGMIEVGEASLRIGQVAGTRQAAEAKARDAYLTALFRARQQGSLAGVLRAAEAFAALGDREVVEQSLRIADSLAARDPDPVARERVRAFAAQLADRLLAAEASDRPSSVAP